MKKKKYLIVILLLVLLVTSFLLISKKPNTKNKKLKELNYNVTYKEAFPDENLRRGVLLCIMRNKCGATEANNSFYGVFNYTYGYDEYQRDNIYSTKDYVKSNYGTAITESDLIAKENETISKVDLDRLEVLLTNVYRKTVNSLQGIEYLPNIKVAVLPSVKKEHIDFSHNKELLKLLLNYEERYDGGTSITKTVNLDQNTKLKELLIILFNEEKSLNYSFLTNLESLYISYSSVKNIVLPNSIKSINLRANKIENITLPNGIMGVDLSYNEIENIVIPNTVRNLDLSGNNIAHIDLPEGVQTVDLDHNKLKNIVVPNSVLHLEASENKIENITLGSEIKDLTIRKNNLKHLDLPEGIKYVRIEDNKIENLTIPSSVIYVWATNNNISNDIVVPEGVTELLLGNNKISNITLAASLKTINLTQNNISNIDLSNLVNAASLDLDNNPLQSIDVRNMVKLETLYLKNTKIKNDIDFKNNVNLERFEIGGVEEGEEPRVENFDFTNNLKLKTIEIKDRNLKNFDLGKYVNLKSIELENNIMNPNLDLSRLTNLKQIILENNKLTNLKLPDINVNHYYLSGKETIKLKVKKNSYVTIPKVILNNKESFLRSEFYYRNGETYLFNTVGKFTTEAIIYTTTASNAGKFVWTYEIEVEEGEEHTFNASINQGNYTPLINEEIPVNNLKEMITNLPANIKNFEIISAYLFTSKGDKTVKVRITFSDDTFKEVDIPIKVYEKEDILPTVTVTPETLEILDKKSFNINITRFYAKEDNVDNTNFVKTVRDNLVSYEYLNKANGLTYNSNSVTGVIDYLFTGNEEEHTFNITYKEQGKIYTFNKNISIKLLRDTDKDGIADKDDDDKDGDGYSNAVEIARGSDPYNKDSFPDMSKKDELDNLVKQLEKLIEDTKNNPFDTKNKLDVDNLKNNYLPLKVTEKDNIKTSYDNTTSDIDLLKLIEKVKKIIDDIKKEINKLRDKASFIELDKEIAKEIDEDFYLEDEVKALKDKIKEAKNLDRNTSTQEEVDKLTKDIKDLRDKLVINKSKLKDKIDELEKKIEDNSCREEECKKVLHLAKDLYNKESFTKKEMLDMIENIDNLLNRKGSLLNPKTGIKTYSLIILFIIFVSYLVFKKHKNYIR